MISEKSKAAFALVFVASALAFNLSNGRATAATEEQHPGANAGDVAPDFKLEQVNG